MSTRNPMNERYTKEEQHSGSSRRSASSSKIKTKAASSVRIQSEAKTAKEKKAAQRAAKAKEADKARKQEQRFYNPPTQRYKTLRRMWWVFLIGAIVMTVLSWILQTKVEGTMVPAVITMVLAYAAIILALYIDLGPTRKERKRYAAAVADKSSPEYAAYKAQIAQEKADAKAAKAVAEEKYEENKANVAAAKKGLKSIFGKKEVPAVPADAEAAAETKAE